MSGSKPVYIIAEMAWSHSGSVDHALTMVEGAHKAGATAFGIHLTSMPDYMVRDYRCLAGKTLSGRGGESATIYDYLDAINLSRADLERVVVRARELGIELVTMCNDEASFELSQEIGAADKFVISAACFTERCFVERIAGTGRPIIFRIGGALLGEIERAVEWARGVGNNEITLLHGIQLYPTPLDQLCLGDLFKLRRAFRCDVGLADHIDGDRPEAITLPALALPYGVTMIEKHITVDRAMKLEDYEAALGLEQFASFVHYVRAAETALGDGALGMETSGDQRYRSVVRKRVVANRPLQAGETVRLDDLAFKRSDTGIDVDRADLLVGRRAARDLRVDEGVDFPDVEPA